jgi:hypothetical protein
MSKSAAEKLLCRARRRFIEEHIAIAPGLKSVTSLALASIAG